MRLPWRVDTTSLIYANYHKQEKSFPSSISVCIFYEKSNPFKMRNIIKVLLFKFCVSSSAQSTYVCRERDIRYFDLSILEPIRPNRGHLIHQYERKSNKIINMTNVVLFIAKQFGLLWTCFPAISVEYHYIMWCLYNIKRIEGSKLCQNGDRMLKNMCSAARRTCS